MSTSYTEENEEVEEPPANSMEELLFRELAVLKLGVRRDQKIPFLLRYSPESGRGMIASKNIKMGEVIIEESPAVWGPKATSDGACCLECGQHLFELADVTFCNLCNFHFCSIKCSNSEHHSKECSEMHQLNVRTDCMDRLGKLTLVIVTLRCLLLPETAPQNWARIRLLQDHLDSRKDSKLQNMNQEFLVRYLREVGLDRTTIPDTEILRICGILESNAFEIKTKEGHENRAVYPLCSMANSSCLPNMTHVTTSDRKMVMVASRNIKKGEELCICYTGIRWGRIARRKHLLLTKCFLCRCPRCLDPTECGTMVSATKCSQCQGVMVQEPQTDSVELNQDWICTNCSCKLPHTKVLAMEAMVGQVLKLINKKSSHHLEGAARKLSKLLSPHHYILQEIYINLIALYEKNNENPERIAELCSILLPVLVTLEGMSRAVAILTVSQVAAQIKLYQGSNKENLNTEQLKAMKTKFEEAYSLVQDDVQTHTNLEEVKQILKTLT